MNRNLIKNLSRKKPRDQAAIYVSDQEFNNSDSEISSKHSDSDSGTNTIESDNDDRETSNSGSKQLKSTSKPIVKKSNNDSQKGINKLYEDLAQNAKSLNREQRLCLGAELLGLPLSCSKCDRNKETNGLQENKERRRR
jgi:hypothetical protein